MTLPTKISGRTNDKDVRQAVLKKILAEHIHDPRVLVVEELGLAHGSARVDIAVVNGFLHGYELKSHADNLNRLPNQIAVYSKILDRATLVVAENHLCDSLPLLPEWWGIKVASVGSRGSVNLETYRSVGFNTAVVPFCVAQLLWRNEAESILLTRGIEKKALRTNRAGLYQLLCDELNVVQLRSTVREQLKCRKGWRDHSLLESCDD
jgi:hypothetical protein